MIRRATLGMGIAPASTAGTAREPSAVGLDPRLSKAVTAHAFVGASLSLAHSLRARGLRRTLLFAGLGHGLPILGEYLATDVLNLLRHRTRPRPGGVPVAIALGWYNVGYGIFAVMESILSRIGVGGGKRTGALSLSTALVATSLDLLMDPFGLDLGLWEWSSDGWYAAEIVGPNGKQGVPLSNFAGWFGLTASVALAYQSLDPTGGTADKPGAGMSGSPETGRYAALLLLPYYLPAVGWALRRHGWRYLLHSAPFSVALWTALKGRSPASWRRLPERWRLGPAAR